MHALGFDGAFASAMAGGGVFQAAAGLDANAIALAAATAPPPPPHPLGADPAPRPAARHVWALFLARICEVFPFRCAHCGGDMRVVAFITDVSPPCAPSPATSPSRLHHPAAHPPAARQCGRRPTPSTIRPPIRRSCPPRPAISTSASPGNHHRRRSSQRDAGADAATRPTLSRLIDTSRRASGRSGSRASRARAWLSSLSARSVAAAIDPELRCESTSLRRARTMPGQPTRFNSTPVALPCRRPMQ